MTTDTTTDDTVQLKRCLQCSRLRWPGMLACPGCLTEPFEYVPASGEGTLWTYTIAHRSLPAYQDQTPFAVGIFAFDERPDDIRVYGRIVDCPVDDVRIGMRLRVHAPTSPDVPYTFEPIG